MIYYDERSWVELVLRFYGTAWESTWHLVLLQFLMCCAMYFTEMRMDLQFASEGHTIFASTMSYLLVFRANNASERYWLGRTYLTHIFLGLREFVMGMCVCNRGGNAAQAWLTNRASKYTRAQIEDGYDLRASMARVNTIRLVLAFVVSLKLHTRICYNGYVIGRITSEEKWIVDWYRLRLRCLVTRQEFEELNDLLPILGEEHVTKGAACMTPQFLEEFAEFPEYDCIYEVDTTPDMRQPLAILFKMWIEITKHMNEPWGFKERFAKDFLNTCHNCSVLYESITMVVCTPIPFPYVHLCKVLLVCFLITTPLVVDTSLGFFANVILPTAVSMSLLGIDAIATELENPFGDDANDLDIVRGIGQLEVECMQMLELSGDHRAQACFMNLQIPLAFRNGAETSQDPKLFMCLCSQFKKDNARSSSASVSFQESSGTDQKRTGQKGANEEEDDDPRKPLLSRGVPDEISASITASSQHGFVPIAEFGTGTIDLEEGGGRKSKMKEAADNVGLSDDEGSAGDFDPQSPMASGAQHSGLPEGAHGSGLIGALPRPGDKKSQSASITASMGSKGGFRPMGEFGTETVQLEMAGEGDELGVDVIGLSDDEDEPFNLSAEVIMEEEGLEDEDDVKFVPLGLGSASSFNIGFGRHGLSPDV